MKHLHIPILFLSIMTHTSFAKAGGGYFEFSKSMNYHNTLSYQQEYNDMNTPGYIYSTKIDIPPEECRFYLTYKSTGKSNYQLLKEAEIMKDRIHDSLKTIGKKNIAIEMASFRPDQYLGSLFTSQKEEIEIQFRIIVPLEKDFWTNSTLITQVLDIINNIKKDQKLNKNLIQGDVIYAVKSIEPYIQKLMEETETKLKNHKSQILRINQIPEDKIFFNITYNELYIEEQTLEKITLVLPYRFTFKVIEEEKKP